MGLGGPGGALAARRKGLVGLVERPDTVRSGCMELPKHAYLRYACPGTFREVIF